MDASYSKNCNKLRSQKRLVLACQFRPAAATKCECFPAHRPQRAVPRVRVRQKSEELLALTEKMTDDDTKYQELLLYPVSGHSSSPIAAIFEVEGETHEQEQAVALRGLCDRGGGRADLRFGYFSSIRR